MATDRSAARRRNDRAIGSLPLPASDPPDLERVDILVGLGRIEGLAHHLDRGIGGRRRGEADFLHQLGGVGSEEDLFGHLPVVRSEEHTSELQSLMRISYAVFCLKKKKKKQHK